MPESSPFKYDKADESAGFLLWKITALWQRKLSEVLGEFGITQTQYAMLASLRWFEEQREPTTQAHLVEHAKIDKMTVSKAIRKLEEDGFVLREQSSFDSRATNVRFTAQGRRVIQKAIVAIENADEEFFSCSTEKQLETYKSLTSSVIENNDL
ncbi:MAG TPA: MarR family transcriptional regulator [Acidiferrobacterales bacterium]